MWKGNGSHSLSRTSVIRLLIQYYIGSIGIPRHSQAPRLPFAIILSGKLTRPAFEECSFHLRSHILRPLLQTTKKNTHRKTAVSENRRDTRDNLIASLSLVS